MRKQHRFHMVLLFLCLLGVFIAGCTREPAQIRCQEMEKEESVPNLTARPETAEVQVAGTWRTEGLNVTYLIFPGVYHQLGSGVFYCYPDADHYEHGVYYQYDEKTDRLDPMEVQTMEEMTPVGQVRFRWWLQDDTLRLHNLSDQQLQNDYTLDAPLVYASAIQGDTTQVLLQKGGGTEHVSFYKMDLNTETIVPVSTGTEASVKDAAWNSTATRILLRLKDNAFYLGDGGQPVPLQALTRIEAPIVQAHWQGADHPEQLLCISQEDDGSLCAWSYDCASQTTVLLLADYAEYQGSSDERAQFLLLSEAYALRRDPDGTTYLLDLSQKSERIFSDFSWKAGIFSACSRETALYIARGERGITSLGYLNCSSGIFRWFHRVPQPDQVELFDLLTINDHVFGIAAQPADGPDEPSFLYLYHFSEQMSS